MGTTLQTIFQEYKGILAADERPSSMDKRLESRGIEPSAEMRSRYRHMLFSTPNLERTISGVILSEDTFADHSIEGVPTRDYLKHMGIAVGVKVDEGLEPYNGSDVLSITTGLETLDKKCAQYAKEGAAFTKWRAVIPVTGVEDAFLAAMASNMATYAQTVLKHNLVPIVEPEVLLKGTNTIDEVAAALERTLEAVVHALRDINCNPHQCILKTSFAATGLDNEPLSADTVAERTLAVFKKIGLDSDKGFYGIVFLSGGLSSETAISYIQRIRAIAEQRGTEFSFGPPLTFSYGRALQDPALTAWDGKDENAYTAQIAFTQTLQHAIKKYKGTEDIPLAGNGKRGVA